MTYSKLQQLHPVSSVPRDVYVFPMLTPLGAGQARWRCLNPAVAV